MCDPAKSGHQIKPSKLECLIYEHYQELARNEDRLFNERLSNVLTVQSILLAAFMVTFSVDKLETLQFVRIIVAIAGIIICVVGFFITLAADQAWHIWVNNLKRMEESFKGNQSNINVEMPYEARERNLKPWGKLPHIAGMYLLPLMFMGIWIVIIVFKIF